MRFVLDASVTLCWCFHDEENPLADRTFSLLQNNATAIVPAIWWFEIRNAAILGIRKKRIDDIDMAIFFERIGKMVIDIAELPATDAVFALAKKHRLTFYDAAYLELAQRHAIGLATLDQALAKAAAAEGMDLVGR